MELEFSCANNEVDCRGWVINFGGLKPVKAFLEGLLDHKTLVAADDPELETFQELQKMGLIQLVVLDEGVGCDNLANYIADWVVEWLDQNRAGLETNADLTRVKVFEHEGNAAEWVRD